MPTTDTLSPQQIALYRATAQQRYQHEASALVHLQEKAWQAARQAAQLLREQFHASQVVVFGSLTRETGFTRWSDVDIAAWGLAPADTFRAIGAIMDMDAGVPVNLVDINSTRASLLRAIEQDGIAV